MVDPVKKNVIQIRQSVNTITVAATGPQGPKGDAGTNGTNGLNGGNYTFEQQVPSASWSVTHGLGYRPAVTVQDYGKIVLEGELNHINANSLTITFSEAVSGYAYLS